MPNHVTNKLLFHPCTEKRFNEILEDLQKEGAEPGSIDLGRIIHEPEGLFMGDLGVEEMKKYKDNNWYALFNTTIIPNLTTKIGNMFNYSGT